MNSSAEHVQENVRMYFSAGMLVVIGFGILYSVFSFPDVDNYPYVRVAASAFSIFSVASGIGIWAKRHWVRWSLLMLLASMYLIFGTTHLATGDTSTIVLVFAVIVLPIGAFLFWRAAKRFVYEAT